MEMKAFLQRENDGVEWLRCPWCGKKLIPVGRSVKVKYLPYKCKACGNISPIVDIGYSVRKKKQIDGQMEMSEFLSNQ